MDVQAKTRLSGLDDHLVAGLVGPDILIERLLIGLQTDPS